MSYFLHFWTVFRYERAVAIIFPPYIMTNGTYEGNQVYLGPIKIFCDTLPLISLECILATLSGGWSLSLTEEKDSPLSSMHQLLTRPIYSSRCNLKCKMFDGRLLGLFTLLTQELPRLHNRFCQLTYL